MKIENLQVETTAHGRYTVGHPDYEAAQFITTITFTSAHYFAPQDRKMLIDMLEMYADVDKSIANKTPITPFTQIK
jgi:hypothetical protein